MFEQVLTVLSNPPGSLVFHFLVLFSVEAALAMAFGQWLRERDQGTGRLTIALLVIGLARAVLAVVAILTWQGFFARNLILPPVERSVDALTALGLMWAFITIDDPVVLKRNTAPDVLAGAGLLLILAGSVYSALKWFGASGASVPYNSVLQDFVWGVAQIAILTVGLLWMVLRIRYVYDAFLKASILILYGGAVALHLILPPVGDIAAATRLGLMMSLPALAAVTYRHVVDKLLAFDAFHATASEPLPMPEAVVDAIRDLPPLPEPGELEETEDQPAPEPMGMDEDGSSQEDTVPTPVRIDESEPFSLTDRADEATNGDAALEAAELPSDLLREYPNAVHVVESLEGLLDSLNVQDAANHVCRAVAKALRADVAAIVSLDEDEQLGVVVAGYDNIAQMFLEGGTLSLDEQPTMVNAMGRLRQMRLTPQRNMRELRNFYKVLEITHTGPAFVQPLHADEHRLGVLMVGSPYAKVSLTNAERTLLDRFGRLVTSALMNATAYYEVVEENNQSIIVAEEQAEAAKARADVLQVELLEVRQQSDEMRAYIDDLERQVTLAKDEAEQNIEQARQTAQEQIEAAQVAVTQQDSARLAQLETELEQTRTASQVELSALRMRLTSSTVSQQELAVMQEQLMSKAREVINLQTRLTEAQVVTETVREQLLSQMENMSDRHEVERLETVIEEQKEAIEQLQTRVDEERETAGMEFEALQKQVELEAADLETVGSLQADLVERNALIQALEAQLADKNRLLTSLQANVGNVDETLRVLEERLQVKTDEVSTLQSEFEQMQDQAQERISALQQQLEAQATGQDGANEALIDELKAEIADKAAEVERLEEHLVRTTKSTSQLETQLATTTAAVEAAIAESQQVDSHDEVIASIAQELRTPMSSIMGYTDLLLGESVGLLGAMQRKFLQRVKTNTERMASLLENLVSITALDSGQFRMDPEKVSVAGVIEEAISASVSQFQEKNLTLRLQIADDLPSITADRDAVHQIVTHLLTNASLASPVEGEVMLGAQQADGNLPGPDGEEHQAACVLVSVTDTGSGISPEDQERVFLRKYRADNPLIEGLGDTGVALSIAKTLVDTHGGRIWLESGQNVGTTFQVLLPIERVAAPMAAEPPG